MGKRVPRRKVVDDGIPIDPALIDPALYAPTPFNSSPSAPSHTPPHGSGVNLTRLVPTASPAENRDQVTLQQALTQAAVSQAQEAIKNAEANSYQLQQQIATQQAQLNEAEFMIDLQEKSIEESTDNAKRLRTNVAQQSATTEAREEHISLLEIRLAEVNSENARISVLAQKRSESYHQQMIDMESRILDLERDLDDANTDLLEHKKLVKLEKEDWSNLHAAMQATESRKAACFGRMAEALSHLNEMMSVVSDKINGFERTMTNPYPRGQDSTDNLPKHHDRAHVSPRFSIQDLNFPVTLPTMTKRTLSNALSAAPSATTESKFANTPSAVQPAITNNEVTDTLATNIQPQTPEPPIPFCDSEFDSLDLQFFAAEEGFQRVDWCEARNVPYNEDYELGVPLKESPMPDAPENAKPTSSNIMTSEMAQPMFQTATHDANTETTNAPFDMAPGSGYGLGMLSEETLAGITGALQHEEQRQTNFIIPDFGAAPLAEAPTTTEFHQPREVPIIDITMTDDPAIDLLPPSPHVGWNGVLDPAASALSAPERKRARQVYGFWEPDNRTAESWDGNLYVKRTKLTLPLSRPRYLNARKRWVKAVKSHVRVPIPTTPLWTMPAVISLSATFAPPPTQIDSTMAASTDPIVAPAPIVEQAPIASVLAQQAKIEERWKRQAADRVASRMRPPIYRGPGPRTYPVYKAISVRDPGALEVPVAARIRQVELAKDFANIRRAQAQPANPISRVRTSAVVPGRFGFGLQDVHDNPRKITVRTRFEQWPLGPSVNGPQAVDSGLHHPVSTPPVPVPMVAAVESPEITFPGVIRQSMSLLFKFLLMAYYLMDKVSGYARASILILMSVLMPVLIFVVPVFARFILAVLQAVCQETRIKAPGLVFSLAPIVPLVSRAILVFLGSIRRHCPSRLLLVLALLVAIEYTAYSTQWKGYERQYICHLDHLRYSRFCEWPWLEKIDYWVTRWLADDRGTVG
ncbi:hypothetical protein N7499_002013 [Penicillium canescens]|nr:hypothetical protein N7499_002013 [Penicillium canescens]KAJ6165627.1 hypothetical protein N7485_008871 [Penicillium canescens]